LSISFTDSLRVLRLMGRKWLRWPPQVAGIEGIRKTKRTSEMGTLGKQSIERRRMRKEVV
jgi:hypothetical protein